MKKEPISILFFVIGILFTTALLISNILAVKIIQLGSVSVPAGVLVFPIAYIINDVIVEVYGFRKAKLMIWTGFFMNLFMLLFFSLSIFLPSAPFWENQDAFATILGSTPRIVFASLMAYLSGSFLNAFVMSRMKMISQGKQFSLRAILSTLVGELTDSIIFISIAFVGTFSFEILLTMIATQAMIKTTYEIIVLPITTVIVRKIKEVENIDVYDYNTSYNPFKIITTKE